MSLRHGTKMEDDAMTKKRRMFDIDLPEMPQPRPLPRLDRPAPWPDGDRHRRNRRRHSPAR